MTMFAQRSPPEASEVFAPEFQHQNFGSNSRYHSGSTHPYDNMVSTNSVGPDDIDFLLMQGLEDNLEMDQNFFNSPAGGYQMNMGMFQNQSMPTVDPSHVWQSPIFTSNGFGAGDPRQTQPIRKSALSSIVNSRDQVVEQFGQITPPEEDKSDSVADSSSKELSDAKRKHEEEDIAKQNRTQRARNAANKRHSKSKAARRDSTHDIESDGTDSVKGQRKSTNVQREKNRLAAAKCRAKKKANSEDMQEIHREGSKQNIYLHRKMLELRDQKAFLRNSLLQHEPGVCQCHAIHRFNFAQAQQLAMGVGAMIGQPLSPSQESIGSGMTPGSDGSLGMQSGAPNQGGMPQRISISSRPQSFNNGSNFNIGQVNCPKTYPAPSISPDQSAPGQFADFLQSSPNGGRGGFS